MIGRPAARIEYSLLGTTTPLQPALDCNDVHVACHHDVRELGDGPKRRKFYIWQITCRRFQSRPGSRLSPTHTEPVFSLRQNFSARRKQSFPSPVKSQISQHSAPQTEIHAGFPAQQDRRDQALTQHRIPARPRASQRKWLQAKSREHLMALSRRAPRQRAQPQRPSPGCDRACRRPAQSPAPPASTPADADFPTAPPTRPHARCLRPPPCPGTSRVCCTRTAALPAARLNAPAIPATGGSVITGE